MQESLHTEWNRLRQKIIGLGEESIQKSHYPQLMQRLRELERFSYFADKSSDLLFILDSDGKIVDGNTTAADTLGYNKEELLGNPFSIVANLDRPNETTFFYTKEGAKISVRVSIQESRFLDQAYTVIIGKDLTEQVQFEEELKKSEDRFKSIFYKLKDIYFRTDEERRIILCSPSVQDILGYTSEECMGQRIYHFLQKEKSTFQAKLQKTGIIKDEQIQLRGKQDAWVSATAQYYYTRDGSIAGIEGVLRDITREKLAEDQLQKSNETFKRILDSASDIIIATDPKGRVTEWNRAASQHTNRHKHEMLNRPIIGDPFLKEIGHLIQETLKKKQPMTKTIETHKANLLASTSLIQDGQGAVLTAKEIEHSPQRDFIPGTAYIDWNTLDLRDVIQHCKEKQRNILVLTRGTSQNPMIPYPRENLKMTLKGHIREQERTTVFDRFEYLKATKGFTAALQLVYELHDELPKTSTLIVRGHPSCFSEEEKHFLSQELKPIPKEVGPLLEEEKLILLQEIRKMQEQNIHPTISNLQKRCNLSRVTVKKRIDALESLNLVETQRKGRHRSIMLSQKADHIRPI
ncbi:MAG: PAS domain S-box protein [Nanobdellota archaeon]